MRYFKSLTPSISVYSGATVLRWRSTDGITGYLALEDEKQVATLESCIKRKVGGDISEVDEAEFKGWEGKVEGVPEFRPEREAYSPGTTSDTVTSRSPSPLPTLAPAPVAEATPAEPVQEADAPPSVRKRKASPPK